MRMTFLGALLLLAAACEGEDPYTGTFRQHCQEGCDKQESCFETPSDCDTDCAAERQEYEEKDCLGEGDDFYRCIIASPDCDFSACDGASLDLSECLE